MVQKEAAMKVFISTTTFAQFSNEPLNILKKNKVGYSLNPLGSKLSESEIGEFLKGGVYSGLIAGTESITKEVLTAAKSLRIISRVGVGTDNIDLTAAKKLNIKIYNTPDVLIDSVAELTIGLILSALRKISLMDRNTHNKAWKKEMGLLFKGKRLGIIGFGRIGMKVATLARAFGAEVIFHDIRRVKTKLAKQVSLAGLISGADIISFHSSAKGLLLSKKEINSMRDGVVIVNTSRGSAIDEEALYDGLISGKIAFAALDVFRNEPYSGKLTELENCILTPHIGSYAKEARIEMEIEAVSNFIKGSKLKK